jgi:hypothetical protein
MKRIKPSEGNKTFCMAPWTHTYLSPQMERRLCCSSRESAENFKQYIDTYDPKGDNDRINLTTLAEHWNSEYMRSVRLRLLAGEEIPQCAVCNHKLLNEQVYRQHFNWLYKDKMDQAYESTDETGVKEFTEAVEDRRITELYWCGGEPLMWKIHWEAMSRIVELGYQDQVLARYNSNMSRINFYGKNLFDDILSHFPKFQICASIDGTGEVGEYVRTGLKFDQWKENMKYGLKFCDSGHHYKRMQLDLTITLPGLFDLENMVHLSNEFNIELLTKQVFNFSNDNAMAPLFMPYDIMSEIINDAKHKTIQYKNKNLRNFFRQLDEMLDQKRNNELVYNEEEYTKGQKNGKAEIERLDRIRGTDIKKILAKNKKALEWWTSI